MSHVEITYKSEVNGCVPKISVGTRFEKFSYEQEVSTGTGKIICELSLKPIDTLLIKFSDKVWNNIGATWLEITQIEIDNITLDSVMLLGKQYPDYNGIDFDFRTSPPYYCPGTIFNLNGVYELEVYFPIWHFKINRSDVP